MIFLYVWAIWVILAPQPILSPLRYPGPHWPFMTRWAILGPLEHLTPISGAFEAHIQKFLNITFWYTLYCCSVLCCDKIACMATLAQDLLLLCFVLCYFVVCSDSMTVTSEQHKTTTIISVSPNSWNSPIRVLLLLRHAQGTINK